MANPSSNVVTDKQKGEGQEVGKSIKKICQLMELNKCEQRTSKTKPSNPTKITENHSKEYAVVINLRNVNNSHSDSDTKSEGEVTKQDGKKRGWRNISYVGSLKQKQEIAYLNLCTANEHGKFKDAELTGSGRAQESGMNNLSSLKVLNRKLRNWKDLAEMEPQKDPDYFFLRSILPDMKQMTDEQKRKLKKKMLKAVDEILKN